MTAHTRKRSDLALVNGGKPPVSGLDAMLSEMVLNRTVGDIARLHDGAGNARTYLAASMVFNAIFEKDVGAIASIVNRVDGTVPNEDEREGYANYFGDAIEDVLDYTQNEQILVSPLDPCIIGLAKAVVYVAYAPCGKNPAARKERQKAMDMVLGRTGGRKTQPTRPAIETTYVRPEWMSLDEKKE